MRNNPPSSRSACTRMGSPGGENLAAFSRTLNIACSISAGCKWTGPIPASMLLSTFTAGS